MLCKYKNTATNLFGEVGKGLHSYRIFDIAYIDVILTIIGAYIIKLFFPQYKFIVILIILFLIGIICHYLFCIDTTVHNFLFDY
jgi:hypothetical protein